MKRGNVPTTLPTSTGIGAPAAGAAPVNMGRSAAAQAPQAPQPIPFTRGSSDATFPDATVSIPSKQSAQINLQTNSFLAGLIIDVSAFTSGNSAAVAFAADGPFSAISQITLVDPANTPIITPITGYQLYLLNKYLGDTDCNYDAKLDPNYAAVTGTSGSGGTFGFRLAVPIENRHRDAFCALSNAAANQRYLLTINAGDLSTTGQSHVYTTAPTTPPSAISVSVTQRYWTSPPATITTAQGAAAVSQTPAGLGSMGFVRFEEHNEVAGGGAPQVQFNNVGEYISAMIFVLRNSSGVRDQTDWPATFNFWVNDFQMHSLGVSFWQREMARFHRLTAGGVNGGSTTASTPDPAGALDLGVYSLSPFLAGLFDRSDNFGPANQMLATAATTKLQIRGTTFGSGANTLEVITRTIRPVSGQALFA